MKTTTHIYHTLISPRKLKCTYYTSLAWKKSKLNAKKYNGRKNILRNLHSLKRNTVDISTKEKCHIYVSF